MKLPRLLFLASCVTCLGGCSWLEDWPPASKTFASERPPRPEVQVMQTSDATWLQPDRAVMPVESNASVAKRDGAAMDRLAALEQEVAQLRNDMSTMMPALTRLAQVQVDLQAILQNYQPAAGTGMGAPTMAPSAAYQAPVQNMPAAAAYPVMMDAPSFAQQAAPSMPAAAPVQSAYQPAAASIPAAAHHVSHVRFGEHGNKTRLVFDADSAVDFRYDVDNNEKIMMVALPSTAWDAMAQSQFANSPLVASYSAMPDGSGGTNVAVQLRQAARVEWAESIPPSAGKGYRIVLDIAGI